MKTNAFRQDSFLSDKTLVFLIGLARGAYGFGVAGTCFAANGSI